jgi:hypothetical protein
MAFFLSPLARGVMHCWTKSLSALGFENDFSVIVLFHFPPFFGPISWTGTLSLKMEAST